MENFSVRTTLTMADWNTLALEAGQRVAKAGLESGNFFTRMAPNVVWLLLIAAFVVMLNTQPPLIRPLGIAISVVGFFGIWWIQYWIQRRAYTPRERGAFLGDQEFDFEAAGFRSRRTNSDAFNRWSLITDVTHTDEYVFLWIDKHSGYVVPARDLPAPMTAPSAADRLRAFMEAAAAAPVHEAGTLQTDEPGQVRASAPPVSSPNVPPSVVQELRSLLRLHSWGLVNDAKLFGRDVTLILLGAFSLLLWMGLDRLTYEGDVEFFIYGLAENSAMVLAVFALAWLLSRASRPRIAMRASLLLVLGFLPIYVLFFWIVGSLPWMVVIGLAILLTAWAERYFGAGMRSLTGRRQWIAVTSTLAGVLGLVYLSSQFYFSPGFWIERDADAEQAAATQRQNEQIVFEQSARINADISSLALRVPDQPNVFFIGFAGYGGQKVFAEEVGLAAKRIGNRYNATQRSLLLVNDQRDSLKHPLATVPSLRHALNALSQHMNVEEDILFLALSSHGSEDGTVSVSSELGYWRDLEADDLADMLRESGIRWRVIIVSACYSGAFVEPLKDDGTIILTAAAADRTSFGCSDDNDLTYFGEAFYRDALPQAPSLRAAFEAAREAILKRETREGETPSEPQAYFGKAIEQKLAAIEAARSK